MRSAITVKQTMAQAKVGTTTTRARALKPHGRLNSPELMKVLLTVNEAAHKLSIGRTTCYALMKRGELRYIIVGSTRRIPIDAVSEFIAQTCGAGDVLA
jgi:excisionase family DNA binding protein